MIKSSPSFLSINPARPCHAAITGFALGALGFVTALLGGCGTVPGSSSPTASDRSADSSEVVVVHPADLLRSGDPAVRILGNPTLISDTPHGEAVLFNGVDDALLVAWNPLDGLSTYTLEVLVRFDAGGSLEPRFLHLGDIRRDRLMLEARLNDEGGWVMDSYLRAGEAYLVLIDYSQTHPVGEWAHMAVVVEDGHVKNFVNGQFEMEGSLPFHPLAGGAMAIGMRMNEIHWFRGAIHSIRVTPGVLTPNEFTFFPRDE